MPRVTRNGKCVNCSARRHTHTPDDEGLRLLCPDGSGRTFAWDRTPGRASTSFNAEEARVLEAAIAQVQGSSARVSPTNPVLAAIRRKALIMKARTAASAAAKAKE